MCLVAPSPALFQLLKHHAYLTRRPHSPRRSTPNTLRPLRTLGSDHSRRSIQPFRDSGRGENRLHYRDRTDFRNARSSDHRHRCAGRTLLPRRGLSVRCQGKPLPFLCSRYNDHRQGCRRSSRRMLVALLRRADSRLIPSGTRPGISRRDTAGGMFHPRVKRRDGAVLRPNG